MMSSLRARLLTSILAVVTLALAVLGALSYRTSVAEFDRLSDARLLQSARTIDVLAESAGLHRPNSSPPVGVIVWPSIGATTTVLREGHPYEARLGFQYWNASDQLRLTSDNLRQVALGAGPPGFADVILDGERWRFYTRREDDGDTIRVAERYDSRAGIRRDLILEHWGPEAMAVGVLVVLVAWAVRRSLRPLDELSTSLGSRQPTDVADVQVPNTPRELAPVVESLNALLSRVRAAIERERQFASNVAHQLRTPLAGALLHIEIAATAESSERRETALGRAREGLLRLQRLVGQMLDLARYQIPAPLEVHAVADLGACARLEVEEAAMLAADKDLELSVNVPNQPVPVQGDETMVRALVRNIVDNAFRYTPTGGWVQVQVRVVGDSSYFVVDDSGPGIPSERRDVVLLRRRGGDQVDRDGHGLGLPIVCGIVARLQGAVDLSQSELGGLRVSVRLPRHAPEPGRAGSRT